jgi:hypothetical protein
VDCVQVWPYLKPLRKWIHKHRMDQPQWDMPSQAAEQETGQGKGKQQQQQGKQSPTQAPALNTRSAAQAAESQDSGSYSGSVLGGCSIILQGPGSAATLGSSSSVDSSNSLAAFQAASNRHTFQFDRFAVMRALVNGH